MCVAAADPDDHSDLIRRRQHVSTIETTAVTSPSRTLLQGVQQGYPGYCTLRNGMSGMTAMPLQEMGPGPKPKGVSRTIVVQPLSQWLRTICSLAMPFSENRPA